jgi:hypothetical protein
MAAAQQDMPTMASRLCADPPFTPDAFDRVRQLPDYDRLLVAMAADCPHVAMLFSVFVVGEVDLAPHAMKGRVPADFLSLIGPEQAFSCCPVASIP